MPRREPFTRGEIYERKRKFEAAPLPSDEDLFDLARHAAVPTDKLTSFVAAVKENTLRYRLDRLVSEQEEPSRQAEVLRQVVEAAQELATALARVPDALRMQIEPNIISTVRRPSHSELKNFLLNHPYLEIQARMQEYPRRVLSEIVAALFPGERGLPGGWQMPGFDAHLNNLIEKAKAERALWEQRVSGPRSGQRATHHRDTLALGLKALAMGCSPKLANDERGAEAWVAEALDVLDIRYPDPKMGQARFRRMFIVNP
jgi:hypothetical protein